MYYEEKIINGVLCHRSNPNGNWTPVTLEACAERIKKKERELAKVEAERDVLRDACKKALSCRASMNSDVVDVLKHAIGSGESKREYPWSHTKGEAEEDEGSVCN